MVQLGTGAVICNYNVEQAGIRFPHRLCTAKDNVTLTRDSEVTTRLKTAMQPIRFVLKMA